MDNSVIDKLFYGKVDPYSEIYNSKETKVYFNKINDAVNVLAEKITDDEIKENIQDLVEVYSATTEFLVKYGYRIGMRDAAGIFDETVFYNYDN